MTIDTVTMKITNNRVFPYYGQTTSVIRYTYQFFINGLCHLELAKKFECDHCRNDEAALELIKKMITGVTIVTEDMTTEFNSCCVQQM